MKVFKILEIVDRKTVVINAGDSQVFQGQYVVVTNENGRPVYDDESNVLGFIPTYKAVLNVRLVQEKLSICTLIPIELQHDVLMKHSDTIRSTILNNPLFYNENDRLIPEEILRGDKVFVLD